MAKKSGKSVPAKKSVKANASAPALAQKPRKLKQPAYTAFRYSKRIKHPVKLPASRQLLMTAFRLIWTHKRLFLGIAAVYGLLNLIFQGQGLLSGSDVNILKQYFGATGGFTTGLGLFAQVVGASGGAASGAASTYQFVLMVLVSLTLIWALRQVLAGKQVTVREAYYKSTTPLIPFLLVLVVIALQLIPLLIGSSLYQTVISNGIAVFAVEKFIWAMLFALFALLSFYMVSSSLFALYIVTLPNMTPLQSLRSARELVRHRRWTVLRKVIVLPIILFVLAAVIIVPVIVWLTPLTQVVFFAYTMISFVVAHAYMYSLYRELLNE